MNSKKITLGNERCQHLTKRLNRLSIWGFFKYLYANQAMKLLLINFLYLVFFAPCLVFVVLATIKSQELAGTLPTWGSLTMSGGIWTGVDFYYQNQIALLNQSTLWKSCLGALAISFVLSGGLAIIRDAFWGGKLTVFPSFIRGVKASWGYAFVVSAVLSAAVFGFSHFVWWSHDVLGNGWCIALSILLGLVLFMVALYLFILCSIAVTYKQSVKQNLADAWNMLWLNFLPHASRFVIALVPVAVYFAFGSGLLVIMFMLMLGFFYIPFVWQTHMMKTFALFHPVKVNKKGEPKKNNNGELIEQQA